MPRRKERLKRLHEKREEREKGKIKKHTYKEMSKNGELGCKELANYRDMYDSLKKDQRAHIKHPDNNPHRNDYSYLKQRYLYFTSPENIGLNSKKTGNSLESKTYLIKHISNF
jgi:hypothetical protein